MSESLLRFQDKTTLGRMEKKNAVKHRGSRINLFGVKLQLVWFIRKLVQRENAFKLPKRHTKTKSIFLLSKMKQKKPKNNIL